MAGRQDIRAGCSHHVLKLEPIQYHFRWHRAATGLTEQKYVIVKALLAQEEKLQIPRTQKANALYLRGDL